MKRSFLLILIAVALLLNREVSAITQNPNHRPIKQSEQSKATKSGNGDATQDERGTDKAPLSVKLLNTGKSKSETAQEAQQEKDTTSTNRWVIRLGFVGVGIALLQLVAFIFQAIRLKQTIAVMRDTARRDLRAYVDVLNISMSCPTLDIPNFVPGPGMPHDEVIITLGNSGRTRALNVLVHANCFTVEGYRTELRSDFAYPDLPKLISIPSVFSIAPNVPYRVAAPGTIDLEGVRRARKREATVYIYGHADYFDVFGEPARRTPFCYEFMPEQPNAAFRTYKEHNDPD